MGPIPGSSSSWACVAVLRFTWRPVRCRRRYRCAAVDAHAPLVSPATPGSAWPTRGHVDALAVGELGREVQPVEVAAGDRAADRLDRVDDAGRPAAARPTPGRVTAPATCTAIIAERTALVGRGLDGVPLVAAGAGARVGDARVVVVAAADVVVDGTVAPTWPRPRSCHRPRCGTRRTPATTATSTSTTTPSRASPRQSRTPIDEPRVEHAVGPARRLRRAADPTGAARRSADQRAGCTALDRGRPARSSSSNWRSQNSRSSRDGGRGISATLLSSGRSA